MIVLNDGLQFKLLAGNLKNAGTILESVMRVRQYWDCWLVLIRTGDTQFVTRRTEARGAVLALATWYCSSVLNCVGDWWKICWASSFGGSEARHLTNYTHWVTDYIVKSYFIVCYKVGDQLVRLFLGGVELFNWQLIKSRSIMVDRHMRRDERRHKYLTHSKWHTDSKFVGLLKVG